jgi:hypothetical protein
MLDKKSQEIRVLDLDAGTEESPLSGQLRHVFLNEPETACYETISYVWGDAALVASISLDDELVRIPTSAASALRRMRLPSMSRILWIDCICINQHDDDEKGHQVAMMADIFQSSSRTLAHLGDDDDDNNDTKRAFGDLAMIYDMLQVEDAFINILHNIDPELGYTLRNKVDLEAIGTIIGRPYFR